MKAGAAQPEPTAAAPRQRDAAGEAAGTPRIPAAVEQAVEQIAAVMGLRPSQQRQLLAFIGELVSPMPKLPCVSLYAATTPAGVNWRLTYRVAGYPKRTERLGRLPRPALQRARRVSEILQQVKARLMKPAQAHRELYVDATPIESHLAKFEAHLLAKGSVPRYVLTTMTRLRRCMALGEFERIGDISLAALPGLIEALRAYVDPDSRRQLSESTINDYLAVLRQFTRWATPTLLPADPLVNSAGVKVTHKHDRRDILVEELAEIVEAARKSAAGFRMVGGDRAMLYLTAYGTGLRAEELRKLEISWLKLQEHPPYIAIPKESQKKTAATKAVRQPLPTWLAAELASWLGARRSGRVFLNMPRDVAPLFERDRADARSAWVAAGADEAERTERGKSEFLARQTSDGVMVFHSHRHSFATNALAALDLKTAQMLTRHATTAMLTEKYAHSRIQRAAEGVERAIRSPLKSVSKNGGKALAQSAALTPK